LPGPRPVAAEHTPDVARIHFDLSVFDANGLRTARWTPTRRTICIPAREFVPRSQSDRPDRSDRSVVPDESVAADQFLCIGSTYRPDFRRVLLDLARLDYVTDIDLSFAE
jgi:hypothetical protein